LRRVVITMNPAATVANDAGTSSGASRASASGRRLVTTTASTVARAPSRSDGSRPSEGSTSRLIAT
jgi:hypothetical protein